MKNVMTNKEHIEGLLYEHKLEARQVAADSNKSNAGTKYIRGSISVATDDDCMNVIPIEFVYVTEFTKNGGKNKTYDILSGIMEGKYPMIVNGGKDNATKVSVDTALALNDFYDQKDELVSLKINQGGFVTVVNALADKGRNTFKTDMLITKITHIDENPEKGTAAYTSVRGAIFDFKNAILPVEYKVTRPDGMSYFESLEVSSSNPLFTQVWGNIIATTTTQTKTTESAFGEAAVDVVTKNVKEWVITGMQKIPYDFGDENVLTVEEVNKAMQNREVYLAEKKKSRDEYMAKKATAPTSGAPKPSTGAPAKFNF